MDKLNPAPGANETVDSLFEGRLSVIQSRTGYRFSLDALLLARFAAVRRAGRVIDLGAGNGVVALILAMLHPALEIACLEIQPEMAARAARSAALNGFGDRVSIVAGDVRAAGRLFPAASFDAAVSNPPYRRPASGRINPDPEKKVARHEIKANLGDFLRAGAHLLKHGGKMALIYPARRMIDLLSAMREEGLEPKRARMVHSYAASEAALALVEGVKGGRAELTVMPPLILYAGAGKYTPEMNAILAGSLAPPLA